MKQLLRSCILVDPSDSAELFGANYHALSDSGLSFETQEDSVVWAYLQDFYKAHGHVPTLQTLRGHFSSIQENDVVDRLERLAMVKPRTRGDFITYLEEKATDRRNRTILVLAKEMAEIVTSGLEIKDTKGKSTRLLGAFDAVRYVLDRSHDIVAPTLGHKLSGNVMQDGHDFLERYDRIKADPRYGMGYLCGVEQIDVVIRGAKRYELWVHAGFTGSLKSSWALHWAYLQAVYLGHSTVYFSLEMPYIQVRNILYTMHSAHEDFAPIRKKLGIQGNGLDYLKVRDGQLDPNEELFLKEFVVPSINGTQTAPVTVYSNGTTSRLPGEYGDIHVEVADPEQIDFTIVDLRNRAELIYSKTPFHLIFVDHAGLMSSRGRYSSTTERLNEVVRDLKKLAMSFGRGMGIAVVALFQISREGYKAAEKLGGRYSLTALSYANETERSADIVTASWLDDELRRLGRPLIQCLKSRDQQPFERTPVRVDFPTRRFLTDHTSVVELEQRMRDARGEETKIRQAKSADIDLSSL